VSDRHERDEELRRAFQSLADTTSEETSAADSDRVWRALSEELPPSERRELVDRMGRDPALAESWRVARELSRDARPIPSTAGRVRVWPPPWWMTSAAAVLLAAIGIAVTLQLSRPTVDNTFREGAPYVVNALVPSDTTLPREAFRLQWTPGPEGARYHVRVTTDDLNVLADESDLVAPEYVVSRDRLATLAPGSRVLWQVDVVLPEGRTVSSQTFAVKVQ
jgi:hypothetical protein